MLGPNGAGKTSLIRMITTITAPDEGKIFLDGELLNSRSPEKVGYMPEERGLYKKMKVGEQLLYLAQLKGLTEKQAKDAIDYWLNRFEITDWWEKKVEDLSKGMQQKIQFIATILHRPRLLILDEPFTGLDPINTNLNQGPNPSAERIRHQHYFQYAPNGTGGRDVQSYCTDKQGVKMCFTVRFRPLKSSISRICL
jgi:ABC-type uncharacterized transport system ATPase subunit